MNFLTQRPEDDDPLHPVDPLAPPSLDLSPTKPQVLKADDSDTGGGGGPAMVSPQGVALPQEVHTVAHQGPHTTQTVATPEGAAQYEQAKAAQQAEIDAHEKQDKLGAPLRDATATTAAQQELLSQKAEIQKRLAASEYNSQLGKLTEVEDRRRKDLEANTKVTGYWEDKSVPAKVAAALMIGLNQYAQSGRGMGGGNKAYEIFQNAEAADRQKKLDTYTRSKEFLELAQTDKVKARAAYEAKVKDIDTLQIAAANSLEKNLATLTAKSKIPGADAALQEWKAQKDQANAEKNQAVQQHLATQVNSGQTTTTDTENRNKTPTNGPNSTSRQAAEGHAQIADSMKRFAELNSDKAVVAEVQKAIKDQQKVDAANSGIVKPLVQLGKAGDIIPMNLGSRLHSDKAREYYSLMAPAVAAKARELDPVGALNEGSLTAGTDYWNFGNASPKMLREQALEYVRRKGAMADAAVPGWMASRGKPAAPTNTSPPPPPVVSPMQKTKDLAKATSLMKTAKTPEERAQWRAMHDHLLNSR